MSTTHTKMTAEEVMLSRHSVRQFQRGYTIPDAEWNEILELAASAPSSWNLQHWRYLVVREQENKDRLLKIAYGQQQVSDASAVVIVLGDLEADQEAEAVYNPSVEAGKMPKEAADKLINNIKNAYNNNPQLARDEAVLNASLSAMQLMLAAKAKGYDSVPMGGFNSDALIQEYNIPERFIPVVMIPIGKAASPAHATDRFPLEKLVINETY